MIGERHTILFALLQFLPAIHQRVLGGGVPTQRTDTKECRMEVGKPTTTSF